MGEEKVVRVGLVGGIEIYHGFAFSGLINGLAPGQEFPQGWPQFQKNVEGARITVVWDPNREAAERIARVFGIEHVVDEMEQVMEHCDVAIITDDGTMEHQKRARPFLERGFPTYIDKPLATEASEAIELAEIAAAHNAPIMSGSALRYAAETAGLRENPGQLGRIDLATAICRGDLVYYGIHPLELAHSIMGSGVRSVHNVGEGEQDVVKITYSDGRILVLMVSRTISYLFELNLYGTGGHQHIHVTDGTAFYSNMLEKVVQMGRDKKAPVPFEDAVEVIRVLDAAKQSLVTGEPVVL